LEAKCCQIQLCILQFKPIDFHKSTLFFWSFIWLGSSFVMAENEVLKTLCGPNGEHASWEWRELRTEELRYLCSSPNITMLLNCRCMRRTTNVAGIKGMKIHNNL
jgi:hypothetical protein